MMRFPYYAYAVSFLLGFGLYLLGWSTLYPPPAVGLTLLVFASSCIAVMLGISVDKKSTPLEPLQKVSILPAVAVTIFLYSLWIAEFIYAEGIPLLKILLRQPYNYRTFGIPTLHVIIVTFSSFYTVLLFQSFLRNGNRLLLLLSLVNLASALLIFNRGMLMFNLSAFLFSWLIVKRPVFKWTTLASLFVFGLLLLYGFGMLGSLRVSREAGSEYTNDHFLNTGRASSRFRSSPVPEEMFWSYVYISSPLANLQQNLNHADPPDGTRSLLHVLHDEILPDFISKRTHSLFFDGPFDSLQEHRIGGPFNVSTVYSRAYSLAGWKGITLIFLVIVAVPIVYSRMIPSASPLHSCAFAILSALYLFLSFDNTLRFTGFSFQLVYPVTVYLLSKRLPWLSKFFVNNMVTTRPDQPVSR